MRLSVTILMASCMLFSALNVAASCDDENTVLARPNGESARVCVRVLWRNSVNGKAIGRDFARKLVLARISYSDPAAVPAIADSDNHLPPYNWLDLAMLILQLGDESLMKSYLDFAIGTGSANESISFGLGRIFIQEGPTLLQMASEKNGKQTEVFGRDVAWGIANELFGYLTPSNYKRLMVGAHWELLDPDHPHRELVLSIQHQVGSIVRR